MREQKLMRKNKGVVVGQWLLTLPRDHPIWNQYLLSVVSLADRPGTRQAIITVEGATHEITLFALNPDVKFKHRSKITAGSVLEPVNYVLQFKTEDDVAYSVGMAVGEALVAGKLVAEPEGIMGMRDLFNQIVEQAINVRTIRQDQS